jgi:hypothetical protein
MSLIPLFRALFAIGVGATLAGCGDSTDQRGEKEKPKKTSVAKAGEIVIDQPEDLSQRLETFSGGAQTKLVWSWHQDSNQPDPHAFGKKHVLVGIDTRDGNGARVILSESGNYSRPMISEKGQWIVYTDKNTTQTESGSNEYAPVIYKVDWNGQGKMELANGLALDTWIDPKTDIQWVYALRDLKASPGSSIFGSNLFRFQLEKPTESEEVWPELEMSPDNFQLSRDGLKAGGLFPWPEGGIADLSEKEIAKTEKGCWTSTAPDESHVGWVFDLLHRNLRMRTADGTQKWNVDISKINGIDGHEVYHPRWSNHARFFAMTGPYIQEKPGENAVSKSGKEAEVFLVKFNDDYDGLEGWIKLTTNATGDYYPDAWISTGDESYVSISPPEVEPFETPVTTWPANGDVVFNWENARSDNSVPVLGSREEKRICRFLPRALARYYSDYEMAIDGGHFIADEASNAAVAKACAACGEATIEAVITETLQGDPTKIATRLLSYGKGEDASFSLSRLGHHLTIQVRLGGKNGRGGRDYNVPLGVLRIENYRPFHLVVTIKENEVAYYIDGRLMEAKQYNHSSTGGWSPGRLMAGDPDDTGDERWTGHVDGVGIYSRGLDAKEVQNNYFHMQEKIGQRQRNKKLRLRATLLEATALPTPDAIEPYARALVDYTYELKELISGRYVHSRIVVLHWAVLDRKPAPGVPRNVGKTYDLLVESKMDHPQLQSERIESTTSETLLPLYYDATTPGSDPAITDQNDENTITPQ